MLQRQHDHILDGLGQVNFCQLAEFAGDGLEDLPVAFRFPGRGDGRLHRVNKRVQVGRVQIVFFIPGSRREHDVGIQGGGIHAEVEIHYQVDLAGRCRVTVDDFVGMSRSDLFGDGIGMCSQVMLEEVFVALGAGTDGVAAPDEPGARPVLWCVGVFDCQSCRPIFQLIHHVMDEFRFGARPIGGGFRYDG